MWRRKFNSEKQIYNSLISFENNNSPGNDGLTKNFTVPFGMILKTHL